jgi:hypothetical protein
LKTDIPDIAEDGETASETDRVTMSDETESNGKTSG